MTDTTNSHPPVAACRFGKSDRVYDYIAPFPVEPGQKVVVETARGEAKVEVVALKNQSDRELKPILRLADPEPAEEGSAP